MKEICPVRHKTQASVLKFCALRTALRKVSLFDVFILPAMYAHLFKPQQQAYEQSRSDEGTLRRNLPGQIQ